MIKLLELSNINIEGKSNYRLKNYDASIVNYKYLISIENKKYFNRSINKLGRIYL